MVRLASIGYALASMAFAILATRCLGQVYLDNESIYSNQDPAIETRRSDHIRVCFGHWNHDSGMGGMSEWLAQGNLQEYEQMWNRWVNEMGLHDINSKPSNPTTKYKSNFHFIMTFTPTEGGGAWSSGDPWGYGYAMANPGYCRFDPPSGATPHEFGHAWQVDCGGFNGSDSSGAWWECTANWMLLQLLNTYPGPGNVLNYPMYYPAHGCDYYDTWTIWEAAKDDPRYGPAWVNNVWTNATPDQAQHEYILDRMIRCDSSGSPDKAGAFKDLWGDMVKKFITWDYARQRWFASANRAEDGSDWEFIRRCRSQLVKAPGMPGWYRPIRSHWPMEYGFNLIMLTAIPGTTVTCNFQPFCDPVRQSDWRACLVAVSSNGDARYSTLWNVGSNTISLSPDETRLYLTVAAVPRPMKISYNLDGSSAPVWQMEETDAGLLMPYSVWFSNASPRYVSYARPSGVTWTSHTNVDGTVCRNIASTAVVAPTAYVGSNAMVLGSAQVLGSARVLDYAVVRGNAQVRDTAEISGYAYVGDTAQIYGHAKVRDWAEVYNNNTVRDNARVIESSMVGDRGSINLSGSAVSKGTAFLWTTSPSSELSGCVIADGDTANGGSGSHGVHFGWNWGPDPSRFANLADNAWQYCCLTFDNTLLSSDTNNAIFARDYYGVNHGLLMNGCRQAPDSGLDVRGGYVLPLDGISQYVELPPSVNDFSEMSLAVWVKWAGGAAAQRIWSMGDGTGTVMYLTPQDAATGRLRFVISDGTTTQSLDGNAALGTSWTHLAVTFSNTTATLYVNGAPVAQTSAMSLRPDDLNAPLMQNANYLGRGDGGNYLQGTLDEFRCYMRSLSPSEVSALYSMPAPPAVTPPADTTAPTPNAATWLVAPTALNDNTITMSATPGTDASGWVEYYFASTAGGGHASGWVSFNKYTDCGLTPGMAYSYTVKMRDRYGNTTAASSAATAATLVSSAGTASFAYGPLGIANDQITMKATVVTNASGKTEYKFDRAGKSSGWQGSPSWTDAGLTTGASYTYTVTVRDGRGNTSAASAGVTAMARDDAAPQLPIQPAHWIMQPYATISNSISMTAMDSSDPSGVQYYFRCLSGGGPDSGWQSSTTYETPPLPDGTYVYQYQLRDTSARYNTNPAPSTAYAATIKPTTGYHSAGFAQFFTMPDDNLVTFTGNVRDVGSDNYLVQDVNSSATIAVRASTYGQATDASLAFKTVSVSGHLYTFTNNGGRQVTYATVTPIGTSPYSISGLVTNSAGMGLAGVTVYFSPTPNASTNAAGLATTDALGRYSMPILNGTWYVCAGSSNYMTSADQVVVINSASVSNVNFGLGTRPVVSGRVTDLTGAAIAGASVNFSLTPNAGLSPSWSATTDGLGKYSQVVDVGTIYISATASNYLASADRTVVTASGTVTSNVNFALTPPRPRTVPRLTNLLFAAVSEALPPGGAVSNWPLLYTNGGALSAMGTPSAATIGGVKWASNKADGDGFHYANYPQASGLPINGASIVVVARPGAATTANAYQCLVSVFLSQLSINVDRSTFAVTLGHKGAMPWDFISTGVSLGANTTAVLSYIVQPTGELVLYRNGTQVYANNTQVPYTSLTPSSWFGTDINVGKGWNGDSWSSFNGYVGDVFVYTNALSNAERQLLENDLLARFTGPGPRTITALANVVGGIVPEGTVTVLNGATQTFNFAAPGFTVTNVQVDGIWLGAMSSYTFTNVSANHTITASFAPITHTITASAGSNGSVNPSGSLTVMEGTSQTFSFAPNPGYMVDTVLADGTAVPRTANYTFTNVMADHTISVSFKVLVSWTITASAGVNGSIFPGGAVSVPDGYNQTFTIDPDYGFGISNVVVDGLSKGALSSYTFTNVMARHAISATFSRPTVWYKFDEASGTVASDSSGNGRNGTLLNGPTWVAGKYGNAVNLNGNNQYVSCPSGLVSALSNFTASAWVYLNNNSMWNRIFDFGTGTGVYMFLTPQGGAGKLRYAITVSGNGAEQQIDGPDVLPTGSWQHVAVTLSGTSGVLYINGEPVATNASMTLKPSSLGNTSQNYIGKSQWPDPYLNGLVDDFRIYPLALSAADLLALYYGSRTITATAGAGGSISPSGAVQVNYGANRGFAVTPSANYRIASVTVDGASQGAINSYLFNNVTTDHVVNALFASLPPPLLKVSANGNGGLDISWPDSYSAQLLWSPVLDQGASWNPVGPPSHIGSVYTVTVTPTNAAAYYYLSH